MFSDQNLSAAVGISLFVAFLVAVFTTPFAIKCAKKVGAIDNPGVKGTDSERHLHETPTPRMGGLAIYTGFCVSVLLLAPLGSKVISMLIGATILVGLGIQDDIHDLDAKLKLVVQIIAASIATIGGNRINFVSRLASTGAKHFALGWFSIPATVIWIVLITNAVNLIDGLDGLAAGISTVAALSLVAIAINYSNVSVAIIMSALAGACMGFLPYNAAPAKVFMGDTGSTFIGFILAVSSIQGLFKYYALISFVLPFLMFGLPIFDVCYAVILRLANGESPMKADRKHVHYHLLDLGLTKQQTVAVLYLVSLVLGVTAVVVTTNGLQKAAAFLIIAVVIFVLAMWSYLNNKKK